MIPCLITIDTTLLTYLLFFNKPSSFYGFFFRYVGIDKDRVLSIAKKVILEEYLIIGVLEQYEDTLQALETLLPGYFEGAIKIWKKSILFT